MLKYAVIALSLLEAGWFVLDGSHALLTGSYISPNTGPSAGQLGPWAKLVLAAGLNPNSTIFKIALFAYGILWLTVIAGFVFRARWARGAVVAAAVGSLWYLPIGTVLGCIQIALLVLMFRKQEALAGASTTE
jgi:hypothetical protein